MTPSARLTILLGAVAPFLVRLRVTRVEEVGRVAGSLGSGDGGVPLGTLELRTLATIPFLGTTATLRLLGALLILDSRPARPRRPRDPARSGARARIVGPAAGSNRGTRIAVPARPRRGGRLVATPSPPPGRGPRGAVVVDPRQPALRHVLRRVPPPRRGALTAASARCSTSASQEARSSTAFGRRGRTSRSRCRARPGGARGRAAPLRPRRSEPLGRRGGRPRVPRPGRGAVRRHRRGRLSRRISLHLRDPRSSSRSASTPAAPS